VTTHRAAMIGVGAPPDADDPGFGMGYAHADGYAEVGVDLVACADLDADNAAAFADAHGLGDAAFGDHAAMLEAVDPTVVSVCTPPGTHADIVGDCAAHPSVTAIHCEKPMDLTWRDCRRMVDDCDDRDVALTFNHQRRFVDPWHALGERIAAGAIGQVERIEMTAKDLFDWGTHCFDLCGMYTGEPAPDWVLAGVGGADPALYGGAFAHHNVAGATVAWEYDNGVHGIAATGEASDVIADETPFHRVHGTDGVAEVRSDGARLRPSDASDWAPVEGDDTDLLGGGIGRAIADLLDSADAGTEPELSGRRALHATELIFAAWESARRNDRVDCPLDIEGNPLEEMVEAGEIPVHEA
jgi:UDP-N-acetylglucosamine 3-dehydrogenase